MKTRRTERTKRRAPTRSTTGKRTRAKVATEGLAASTLSWEALRESEERYRGLFENSMLAISQSALEGKFLRVNKAYARLYGYATPEEMMAAVPGVGRLYADPEDRKAVLRILSEKGVMEPREIKVVRRDGTRFYVEVLAQEIRDVSGKLRCYQASHVDITERKRAEDALRESEERLRLAAAAAGFGTYTYDFVSGASHWSRELKTLLGVPPGQPLPLDADKLFTGLHPEDRAAFLAAMTAANDPRSDGIFRHEYRVILPDGTMRWLQVRGRTSFTGAGAMRHAEQAAGVILDITERKQILEALRANEERYRLLFEASADGIIMVGSDGLITSANFAQVRMFRYDSPEEMVGMSANLLLTSAMREFGRDLMRRRLSGEETPPVEYCLLRKDGTEFWGEVSAALLRNTSGGVIGYTYITHDTTKRKRTEELLRESESRFRSLFEQAPIAISVSRNGRSVLVNQGVVRTFGLRDTEEWVGRPIVDWTAPQYREEGEERTRRRLLGLPVPAEFESVGLRPDGSQFPIHVAVGQVQLADGPANISFITDITGRKRAEAALRELSGRLLRLEDDERQRIARELHDTTAQELAAITMNLAVLKARAPELKVGAQAILAETIALTDRCASEVRTMSYLLHPPALEALGLAGAGRDYIDGFARRSGLRVDLEISGDFGRLPAETELALFRVLQESLVNIHRHSGSRKASIQLARTTDQIRLEVRDTGRGMKKTDDPLAEGPPAGGLGVGIPGMRERMRQLGGRLQIQSDAQGTSVIATVPVGPKTERP